MKLNEIYDPSKDEEPVVSQKDRYVDPNAPVVPVVPKKKAVRRVGDMDTYIAGIPCQIVVTHQANVKGSSRADNPWDYHGYTELEYDVLDRRGYPAPWLERKMTDDDRERIEREWWDSQSGGDDYDGPDDYDRDYY